MIFEHFHIFEDQKYIFAKNINTLKITLNFKYMNITLYLSPQNNWSSFIYFMISIQLKL